MLRIARSAPIGFGALATTLATQLATGSALAQLVPLGAEFQVSSVTVGSQYTPAVSTAGSGFVVVWAHNDRDGDDTGIFARRIEGAALSELQVNSHTTGFQDAPRVAPDGGGFVVVWRSVGQDGSSSGVFGRRFTSAGAPLGTEFQVNDFTTGHQLDPAVASSDGVTVVSWASNTQDGSGFGVFARRSSAGAAIGGEFQVSTFTSLAQTKPAVSPLGSGFVVVWESYDQDGDDLGVFGQRFDGAGAPVAIEFRVNQRTAGVQRDPRVAGGDSGFVVAWGSEPQDGAFEGVFAQRFDSGGEKIAAEFQVNVYTQSSQSSPAVAMEADGRFLIVYGSARDGDFQGVFGRRYEADGTPLGGEFQINTFTMLQQNAPAIANSGHRFLVVWLGGIPAEQQVFAQRLAELPGLDVDGNGLSDALTDGLLTLRFLFGFRGATLINGAVALDCTRCDAPAIEGYLGERF
jgi:hypothetical protein